MAFNVSYNFIAKDAFTAITNKINKAAGLSKKKIKGLGKGYDETRKKSNRFTRGLGKLRGGFKKLTTSLRKNTGAFRKNTSQMNQSSGLLSGRIKGLLAAAAGFLGFRELIQVGSEFGTSLADLSAITGATAKDISFLKKETASLSKTAITSQAEILTAFKLVASAKPELLKNIPALAAMTKEVLLLKNASGLELAPAAEITAQALNIFGKGAENANEFVNILAAGAKFGSSEIKNTGEAMLIAGPAARAAGLDFLQLNAAIQATARGGIMGSRAGTALNSILGRLRRSGLDFEKLGLEGVFTIVGEKLNSITDSTARAQFEAKIFGEEHAKVGLALVANVKLLGQFEKELKGTNIAQEQADIRLKTFAKRFENLKNVIQAKLIVVFDRLKPKLIGLTNQFASFIDGITTKQLDQFISTMGEGINIGVQFIKSFASELIPFFQELEFPDAKQINGFVKGLAEMAKAANILATPLKIVFSLIKGLGEFFATQIAKLVTGNITDFLTPDFGKLKEQFSAGGKLFGLFDIEGKAAKVPATPSQLVNQPLPSQIPELTSVPGAPSQAGVAQSQSDVNVNIRAQEGTVESIKSKTSGDLGGLNLGVNLKEAS